MGTISEGSCGVDAIAHWSDPNRALAGFGCDNNELVAVIRPKDGALITKESSSGTHVFREDACLTREGGVSYPADPLQNDGVFNFPCSPEVYGTSVLLAPRGGMAFWCGGPWLSAGGEVLYSGVEGAYAYDGDRLLLSSGVFSIVDQTLHPFVDLPPWSPMTWRVLDDGFWLYLQNPNEQTQPELWHVDFNGQAQLLGSYPPPPSGIGAASNVRLAADGTAFQLGHGAGSNDVILRRTLAGASDVVYDEASNPLVKVHISSLVTGP